MTFTKADCVPARKCGNTNLQQVIEEFMESDFETVKLEYKEGDYKNAMSCQSSMYKAIKVSHRRLKVLLRGNEVYLQKL